MALEEVQSDASVISQAGSLARFLPIDGYLYVLNQWELILFEIDDNYQPLRFGKTPLNNNAETLFQLNDFHLDFSIHRLCKLVNYVNL